MIKRIFVFALKINLKICLFFYSNFVQVQNTFPQNTEIFGFLGSKYQIITQLGHQDKNRPYKVSKYMFKWFFFVKTHVKPQETNFN